MRKIVALSSFPHEFNYEREIFGAEKELEFIISDAKKPADVLKIAEDAEVILFTDVTFDQPLLDGLKKCKMIIRYGIGYDNIDTAYAAKKGIIFCNAPNYGVIDVAEHALSLLLSCAKRLTYMNDCVRENFWSTGSMGQSSRLAGKSLGFIGFGKIARCLCKRTNALELKPLVYDPFLSEEIIQQFGATKCELNTLLEQSDFITLHLPLNEHTKHILSAQEFARMKPTSIVINTGRGPLINQADLIDALEQGIISGAGLDVYENEGTAPDARIFSNKSVTLTPHVAWNTKEAGEALHKEVTENVMRYINGNQPESIIN